MCHRGGLAGFKWIIWWPLLCVWLLAGCSRDAGVVTPIVKIMTVVVTTTPAEAPTPIVVTQVQTVVVTVTPEGSPTATPRPAPTVQPPRVASSTSSPTLEAMETETPAAKVLKYPAVVLVAPVDRAGFSADGANPLLRWQPVGQLAPDEYYEVTIERTWQNQPYYAGSDWTKETEYLVPKAIVLNTSDIDTYTWWVTVKRLTGTNSAGNKIGEALSPPSEARTFTWK